MNPEPNSIPKVVKQSARFSLNGRDFKEIGIRVLVVILSAVVAWLTNEVIPGTTDTILLSVFGILVAIGEAVIRALKGPPAEEVKDFHTFGKAPEGYEFVQGAVQVAKKAA